MKAVRRLSEGVGYGDRVKYLYQKVYDSSIKEKYEMLKKNITT